jgi:Tol biopolymer transport system component/DNA-binding winged helix-turn-helix (wHTH) protein
MSGDFWIGEWRVQPAANRLVRGDEIVRLEPKVMHVLVCLAEQAGDVVSREQLIARVWSDVFVTDDVLHRAVRELRRVFGDRTAQPRYIETIRKRGYRLMCPVTMRSREGESEGGDRLEDSTTMPLPASQDPPHATVARRWPVTVLAAGLTLACAAGIVGLAVREDGVTAAHPRFIPMVSGPANESEPALAPDGIRLAYVMRDSAADQADVYVQDSATAAPRRLTDHPADDRMPVWSPDGRRIAFIRGSDRECTIVLRALDTPDEQTVGPCRHAAEPRVAWLDADTLIVPERAPGEVESGRLVRQSLSRGSRTPISDPPPGIVGDHSPVVSPDGRTVAFIRRSTGGISDLFVVAAHGGSSRRVTFDESDITGAAWAARGRALVYSSDRAGGYSLWRVPVEGGAPELLAGGSLRLKHPVATPTGDRIAYESWHYEINIWRVGQVGQRGSEPIIRASELWNLYPQVSPDGRQIAYVSTQSGSHELWVAAADGSERRQLTDFGREMRAEQRGTSVRGGRWSPDSRRLVFTAQRGGQVDVYTVDVRSGALHAITADPAIEVAPSWSADGNSVLFGRRDDDGWSVWTRTSEGGDATRAIAGAVAAQAAGDMIYFTRAARDGVWRWRDGATPDLIADDVPAGGALNWQVAADGLYTTTSDRGRVVVRRWPLDGAPPTLVAELPQYSWPGFAVTPDGSSVLYARWDRRESNIMAAEGR